MKHIIYSIITVCIVFALGIENIFASNTKTVPIGERSPKSCVSIDILESNEDNYVIKVKINAINSEHIEKNNTVFCRLSLDDSQTLLDIGKPALPIITQMIGLPIGKTFSCVVTDENWIDYEVEKIYPAQKPFFNATKDTSFVYDEDVYKRYIFERELISESEVLTWKGIENVLLKICPFKYFPTENKLSILSEFTLTVSFSFKQQKNIQRVRAKKDDLKLFCNKGFLSEDTMKDVSMMRTNNDDYDYLIIVGDIPEIENSQEMRTFRRWKALKGYKTKLVSTATIGSDSASVKSFIDSEYDTYNIKRVLFVGDHTKIPLPVFPARYVIDNHHIVKSDYWYGCKGGYGDPEAEIPIGRFITNTLNDFRNIVNKTIKYESLSHEWSDKILLIANLQYAPGFYQGCMESVRNEAYVHPMSFYKAYAASVENGGNNARVTDIYNHINNGMNIVAYNGHGNQRGWWLDYTGHHIEDGLVYEGDTARLNGNTYPVFVSMACINGDFSQEESIIWQWTRNDHCASAYIGGTVPVFSYPANDYLKNFHKELLNNNNYLLGDLNLTTNLIGLSGGNMAIDNAFCFICGGDPSLELWTGVQKKFDNFHIAIMGDSLTISTGDVCGYSVNVVSMEGSLLGSYATNNDSIITIPLPPSKCDIALNKHDYIPLVLHCGVNVIQNELITQDANYIGDSLRIGYDVTDTIPYGNVVIEPDAKVTIFSNNGVVIKNGFECKLGAEFEIK